MIELLFFYFTVFSPINDEWEATSIMDCDDIKKNANYTKLVFDRLSELRREYQRTEKLSVTGGEDITRQDGAQEVCYKKS